MDWREDLGLQARADIPSWDGPQVNNSGKDWKRHYYLDYRSQWRWEGWKSWFQRYSQAFSIIKPALLLPLGTYTDGHS